MTAGSRWRPWKRAALPVLCILGDVVIVVIVVAARPVGLLIQQPRTDERVTQTLTPGRVTITGRVARDDPDEGGGYSLELLTVGTP